MPNAKRTRAIMAGQKVRQQATPQPMPENYQPKLTAEQRREIYAPKPATSAPQHLQAPEWVRVWKTATRITYGLTAFTALMLGGLMATETRKGFRK